MQIFTAILPENGTGQDGNAHCRGSGGTGRIFFPSPEIDGTEREVRGKIRDRTESFSIAL